MDPVIALDNVELVEWVCYNVIDRSLDQFGSRPYPNEPTGYTGLRDKEWGG